MSLRRRTVGQGEYAQGVRVGPGSRLPRLPALYRLLRRWRLAEQAGPLDDAWRNDASLDDLSDKVFDVMHDQANRGQVIVLPDVEVRDRCPILVVASLGAIRKDNASLI